MATQTGAPVDALAVDDVEPSTEPAPDPAPGLAEGLVAERHELELDPADLKPVIHRIKRAQGQLAGVVRMLEEGRGCEDVVTQLAAVSRALDRVGFALIAQTLEQCLRDGDRVDGPDVQKLEKLFLSLA